VSDVIVELGFVEPEVVERAVKAPRTTGKSVTRILLDEGALDESQLARGTAERHGLDYVDLEEFEIDVSATNLVSSSAARRYGAMPIAFAGDGALVVAMSDPGDGLAVSDISVMTKLEVRPAVATRAGIEAALARLEESPAAPGPRPDPGPEQAPPGVVFWQAKPGGNGTGDIAKPEATTEEVEPDTALDEARAEASRLGSELEQARSRVSQLESARERDERRVAEAERRASDAEQRASELERPRQQAAELKGEVERLRELAEQRRREGEQRQGEVAQRDQQITALRE